MNKKGASQEPLNNVDAEISELIINDLNRQNTHIHLIASENFASKAVMEASGSILTNKYSEGFQDVDIMKVVRLLIKLNN